MREDRALTDSCLTVAGRRASPRWRLVFSEDHFEMATFEAYTYFANATFEGALHGLEQGLPL